MGNDGAGLCGTERSGAENNGLRWQFDYNFDYVTCCGI